jgi:hypothetical protein
MDVETVLGYELDPEERTALLRTPEENVIAWGEEFGKAHMIARNLQNMRASLRTMLREHRMEEAIKVLEAKSVEFEIL